MIVDTSAVVAVLRRESGYERILALLASGGARMSAATTVELAAVVSAQGPAYARLVEDLLGEWGVDVVALDAEQARIAQQAYRDYGRGSGHPARLNLGDCYSYALARARREPLLFVGDDFGRMDVLSALDDPAAGQTSGADQDSDSM